MPCSVRESETPEERVEREGRGPREVVPPSLLASWVCQPLYESLRLVPALVAAGRACKALAVLVRLDEGTHHLRALHASLRLRVVTHVFALLTHPVELREPELVAREVVVRRVVGVAPQVAEVLHQHEGAVVHEVEDRP